MMVRVAAMQNHDDEARARTQQSEDVPPLPPRERSHSDVGALLAGRYRILRTLAAGGMGTVYEGEHALLGHRVAIKMLHPQYAHSESSTKRFMNEARAAAQLRHPNIARCDDVGVTPEGHPFLVLELLSGRDLADELHQRGALELERALAIARQVAGALAHAHAQGVVHRDLKPENVFLARGPGGEEQVKVLDFGVARFIGLEHTSGTRTGAAIGTPLYMAPEQFTDASRVDARADVYGLGVVVYEMLTNQRPFDAPTLPELLSRMSSGRFRPLDGVRQGVPPHVVRTIHACLAADPADRPGSMEALLGMLEGRVLVPSRPPAAAAARGRAWWALAALLAVLVGGALAWLRASSGGTSPVAAPAPPVVPAAVVPARGETTGGAPAAAGPGGESGRGEVAAPLVPAGEGTPAPAMVEPRSEVPSAGAGAGTGAGTGTGTGERAGRRGRKPAGERVHPIADEPDF